MKDTQRGTIGEALHAYFGIKGTSHFPLDESITPAVTMGDLLASPYVRTARFCGLEVSQAALAANFGYVLVRGAAPNANGSGGTIFVPSHVRIVNLEAAAQVVSLVWLTNLQRAALTPGTETQLLDLGPKFDAGSAFPRVQSTITPAVHTAAIGQVLRSVTVSAASQADVPAAGVFGWPLGIHLRGDSQVGRLNFGVRSAAVNNGLGLSIFGWEWPLP